MEIFFATKFRPPLKPATKFNPPIEICDKTETPSTYSIPPACITDSSLTRSGFKKSSSAQSIILLKSHVLGVF